MDTGQTGLSLMQFLGFLRRRAPWILLCFVLAAGIAYGYSKHKTKKYTATAALAFNYNPLDQQIAGLSINSGGATLAAQEASNLELVKASETAARTATLLGHGLTTEAVSSSLSIRAKGESSVVAVAATTTSPAHAAAIANTYVNQFVKEQQSAKRLYFKSALSLVKKQLAALSPVQRFGADGLDLMNRAHTLALLAGLGFNSVQVVQEALVPTVSSSPNTKKNVALSAIVGLLIGLGVAFLLERLDQRIREPEALEIIYRLPMLGVVPKSAAFSQSARQRHEGGKGATLPPAAAEAFSLIRAHLRFFNIDRDLRTVVIASPAPGDGKTTIALHLAEAAARLGSRVLLLEADLRRPTLAQQLDIQSGPGLSDVLIGAVPMTGGTRSMSSGAGAGAGRLDVLVAGTVLPPNPAELLESRAMDTVLERARTAYDLVVIDTPPLTAVSDAFPLLTKVDGVVIVGRIGHSRRAAAEQLSQVLASSGAPLLGVIANESKSGGPVPYVGDSSSSPAAASANGASRSDELAPTAKA